MRAGWTNLPGRGGPDASYAFNSLGARGAREDAPEPAAGVPRLACYGESLVFGTEVADDESWTAQLEALDERVEAVNLGVPAYGTDQALLRFRRRGRLERKRRTSGGSLVPRA